MARVVLSAATGGTRTEVQQGDAELGTEAHLIVTVTMGGPANAPRDSPVEVEACGRGMAVALVGGQRA